MRLYGYIVTDITERKLLKKRLEKKSTKWRRSLMPFLI
jgi:hypothetical protein